jgi:hypothetical protein
VVAQAQGAPFVTTFRFVIGRRIFIESARESGDVELVEISAPALREGERFRLPDLALDLTSNGRFLYYASVSPTAKAKIVELDEKGSRSRWLGGIRGQFVRYPMFVPAGLAFESVREDDRALFRDKNGVWKRLVTNQTNEWISAIRHCGQDFVVSTQAVGRTVIKRIDDAGRLISVFQSGPANFSGACSADGRVWYYSHLGSPAAIRQCDGSGCRDLYQGAGAFSAPSADGTKVGFVVFENRGPVVYWIGVDGGAAHEVGETETGCAPGWSSADTLWVSRRRAGKILWTEVNIHNRVETGRTVPGMRDCSDGRPDPASPVDPDLRIVTDQSSQLRLLDAQYLERR